MDKNKQLDALFLTAREQQVKSSFDETKDQFLESLNNSGGRSSKQKMKFSRTKKWLIMIATVSSIALVVYLFNSTPTTTFEKQTPSKDAFEQKEKPQEIQSAKEGNHPGKRPKTSKNQRFNVDQTFVIEQLDILVLAEDTSSLYTNVERHNVNPVSLDEYIFPKLTNEEIAANHKQKKQMLKALEKMDKKVYSFIPSGSFEYEGQKISTQAFYMQRTEVTNLEYRTFLFDLLIQGRKEEFLKAKPDQAMWTKLFGADNKPMEELYFSHAAYNDYPVVNVSREGAELYCKWLSQEIYKFVDDKKKEQFNDIRIPTRAEWVKAASAEGKQLPYPWDGQFLRNSKGCFLANHKPTDSTYFDDGGFFTVKVNSYTVNQQGLYNMSGNAAEMVYDDIQTKSPGTAGGGWMNNAEEIKILGPDPHKGLTEAHPNVGFRVVMTYLNVSQ
jgi:formylglycine-generating enzyme required for sulfatase activity